MFDAIRPSFYAKNYIENFLNNYKIVQRILQVDYLLFDNVNSSIEYHRLQGGDYERIGELSPLKFYYVRNFPIFLATDYTINTSGEDFGIFSKTEIECVITDFIVPSLFDMIIVKYGVENELYESFLPVFSVSNIEITSIYQKNFYKLKLVPSSERFKELKANFGKQITAFCYFDENTKKFFTDKIYNILINFRDKRQNYLNKFSSLLNSSKHYSHKTGTILLSI